MTDWKVGDPVIVARARASGPQVLENHAVIKVARKYFTTRKNDDGRWPREQVFEIDGGRERPRDPNYTSYLDHAYTPDEWAAKECRTKLAERLRELDVNFGFRSPFGSGGYKLSNDALERLLELLEGETNA